MPSAADSWWGWWRPAIWWRRACAAAYPRRWRSKGWAPCTLWGRPPDWRRPVWRRCATTSGRHSMERERWIRRTLELQSIPSPTNEEHERAAALRRQLEQTGPAEVFSDQVGNLYSKLRGGGRPALVISAHMDSVFPRGTDLSSRRTPTRVYGPGIGDNALALAALVELAHDFVRGPPPGGLWVVAGG